MQAKNHSPRNDSNKKCAEQRKDSNQKRAGDANDSKKQSVPPQRQQKIRYPRNDSIKKGAPATTAKKQRLKNNKQSHWHVACNLLRACDFALSVSGAI